MKNFPPSYLVLKLKNASNIKKRVNLFSRESKVPEGVEIILEGMYENNGVSFSGQSPAREMDYNSLLQLLETKSIYVTGTIRIFNSQDPFWFAQPFIISHTDGTKRMSFSLLPAMFLSAFQVNPMICEINPYWMTIKNGTDIEVELDANQVLDIVFSYMDFENDDAFFNYMIENKKNDKKLFGDFFPILIENPTDEIQTVTLFDYDNIDTSDVSSDQIIGETESPLKISVQTLGEYNGYNQLLVEMKRHREQGRNLFEKVGKLKVFADKPQQAIQIIKLSIKDANGGEKANILNLANYISPAQMDPNIINADFKYENGLKFEVNVLPKTKVLYMFYETNDLARQEARMEFKMNHQAEINDLGLILSEHKE